MGEAILAEGREVRSREVRAASVAVAFVTLCIAVFAGIFAYFVFQAIGQTRLRLEERSQAAAQVVATNAGWVAQVANQTLRRIDAVLGPSLTSDSAVLEAAVEGLPDDIDVYIIDADANTLFATVPGAASVNVADREYFTALRDGAPFYTSGLLVSRLTGENIFVFSKRITRNGDFAGAIMVSFSDALMQSFWSYLDLDTGLGFDSQIVVKVNAPELLRRQLASRRWQGAHIAMGTNVDCYQRAGKRPHPCATGEAHRRGLWGAVPLSVHAAGPADEWQRCATTTALGRQAARA